MDETPWNVGRLVGANLKVLRQQLGLSQLDASLAMREAGFPMSPDVVAALEIGRRESVTLDELVMLTAAFGVPLATWFEVPRWSAQAPVPVRLGPAAAMPSTELQGVMAGQVLDDPAPVATAADREPIPVQAVAGHPGETLYSELEGNAALSLGISPEALREVAVRRWGRTIDAERTARFGDRREPNAARRMAYRARVTRALTSELRRALRADRKAPRS